MTKRPPVRRKKGDRLLHGGADKADIHCDYAIGPLDKKALDMDRKWGIDRLPELVSPETALKYGSAIAKLNAALADKNPQLAAHKARICMKGLDVMDAEAEALGQPKADGDVWEYDLDGFKFGIIADDREWRTLKAKRPDLQFFTMREVAVLLRERCSSAPIADAKDLFPGAEIVSISKRERSELEKDLDDEIPYL